MDGEDNHVPLLVNYPPKHSISALVTVGKASPVDYFALNVLVLHAATRKGVLWSPSYFAASCGGALIGILKAHIEQQKTPQ